MNSNYEPLNVCNMRRAIALMLLGKAEVLEQREQPLATISGAQKAPSVLKMRYQVRRPMPRRGSRAGGKKPLRSMMLVGEETSDHAS